MIQNHKNSNDSMFDTANTVNQFRSYLANNQIIGIDNDNSNSNENNNNDSSDDNNILETLSLYLHNPLIMVIFILFIYVFAQ